MGILWEIQSFSGLCDPKFYGLYDQWNNVRLEKFMQNGSMNILLYTQ